jgi:hypothetical protein
MPRAGSKIRSYTPPPESSTLSTSPTRSRPGARIYQGGLFKTALSGVNMLKIAYEPDTDLCDIHIHHEIEFVK